MATQLLAQDTFFGHGNDNSPIAGDSLFDTPTKTWDAASGGLRGNGAFNGGGGRSWIDQGLVSNYFEYWFEATGSDDASDYSGWIILWMEEDGTEANSYYLKVNRLTSGDTRTTTFESQNSGIVQTLETAVAWPDATLMRFGVTVTSSGVQCWREPGGGGTRTNLGTLMASLADDFRNDATRKWHGINGASGVNSRIRALAFTQLDSQPPKGGGSTGRDPVPASGRVLSSTRILLPVPPEKYSRDDQSQLRGQIMRYLTQLAQAAVDVAGGAVAAWADITGKPATFPPDLSAVELDDLADVDAPTPSSGDLLSFDGSDWVPIAAPSGTIPATTDLGDLLASDGAAFDILPVGADGEVLTADSGAPLGVSWQAGGGGGGGSAPTNPVSGYVAWYEADDLVGYVNGDPVPTLEDRSGNSYDLTASGTKRPTYRDGDLGDGMPYLEFDGSDDSLVKTGITPVTGQDLIVFCVFRYIPRNGAQGIWGLVDGSGGDYNTQSSAILANAVSTGQGFLMYRNASSYEMSMGSGQSNSEMAVWGVAVHRWKRLFGRWYLHAWWNQKTGVWDLNSAGSAFTWNITNIVLGERFYSGSLQGDNTRMDLKAFGFYSGDMPDSDVMLNRWYLANKFKLYF